MRKYAISLIYLIVVAVSLIALNAFCAEALGPLSQTPAVGSNMPPQGYPADFPYIPGGAVYYMPDQLKQTIKVDIILNYGEPAAELFEKLSAAAKAAGWTVDSYAAEEITPGLEVARDTRYRFKMTLGSRVVGGSVFRLPSDNTTHLMISDDASTEPPEDISKAVASGDAETLKK
jgi:hypothetical protein